MKENLKKYAIFIFLIILIFMKNKKMLADDIKSKYNLDSKISDVINDPVFED